MLIIYVQVGDIFIKPDGSFQNNSAWPNRKKQLNRNQKKGYQGNGIVPVIRILSSIENE